MPLSARNKVYELLDNPEITTPINSAIDQFLEEGAWRITYQVAEVIPNILSGGTVERKLFVTPRKGWRWFKSDTVVVDGSYNILSPATVDLDNGRWEFATTQNSLLLINGWSYDPWGAAADFLQTQSAGKAGNLTSFSTPGGNFSFADNSTSFAEAATRYDNMRRRAPLPLVRSDLNA